MPIRTGRQYIEGLRNRPREVWLNGERINDVTTHPAFRRPIERLAHLFDMQSDPAHIDTLSYVVPDTGERVGTSFMIPKSYEDVVKRRKAFRLWAEATFGMMGRTPDFLNCTLASFADAVDVFARGGERFAANVVRYYEYARSNDLMLTHALVTPQNDRSKGTGSQSDAFLHMGVVRETPEGPVLRGARMLATLGPVADELLVYNLPGLQPGEEAYATVFAIPIDTPGLRQICRPPYDRGDLNVADHPLASQFEECDSLLIFDDVLIPWERVFLYKNVELSNALYPDTNLRQYTGHQSAVRALVKLEFATGIVMEIAKAIKADAHLHVQEMLGECINYIEIVKSCISRAETEYETTARGTVRPCFEPLMTLRTYLPHVYPRVIEILQTIGAGGLMMIPSAADFESPVAQDVNKYFQGAAVSAIDRTRLYKLAWDLAGEAFGSRQLQYERYFNGDPVRTTASHFLFYDKTVCEDLVRRALRL